MNEGRFHLHLFGWFVFLFIEIMNVLLCIYVFCLMQCRYDRGKLAD
jgi:hypothetical protein